MKNSMVYYGIIALGVIALAAGVVLLIAGIVGMFVMKPKTAGK